MGIKSAFWYSRTVTYRRPYAGKTQPDVGLSCSEKSLVGETKRFGALLFLYCVLKAACVVSADGCCKLACSIATNKLFILCCIHDYLVVLVTLKETHIKRISLIHVAFQPTFPTLCGLPCPLSLLPDCICISLLVLFLALGDYGDSGGWMGGRTWILNLGAQSGAGIGADRAELWELSSAFCRNEAQQRFWAASFCTVEVQKWWRLRSFNRNLCDFSKQKQTSWAISDYNGNKSDWMSICWEVVASKQMWMCFHFMVGFIYLSNITRTRLVRIL